ncbi:MAG: hypothetical protein ACRDBM_14295, partial [Sporomusa sp.]
MNAVRKAIESMYKALCTVYEYQPVKDPDTKISVSQPVAVLTDQPCRLSFQTITDTSMHDGAGVPTQVIKLFLPPEIVINPGSKITVAQNGVSTDYQLSGKP